MITFIIFLIIIAIISSKNGKGGNGGNGGRRVYTGPVITIGNDFGVVQQPELFQVKLGGVVQNEFTLDYTSNGVCTIEIVDGTPDKLRITPLGVGDTNFTIGVGNASHTFTVRCSPAAQQ